MRLETKTKTIGSDMEQFPLYDVTSAESLTAFKRQLKSHLFKQSYP